jgi:hypothetical protein
MVAQIGYSVVGRSRGRVTPCVICTWHVKTRSAGFLVESQNQVRRFVNHSDGFNWFGLKTSGDGFYQFSLKTGGDSFSQFDLKTGDRFLV